jgi:hypothetical protein
MLIEINLPDNRAVQLEGDSVKYWIGEGLPKYEGPIAGLPVSVISELLRIGAIKTL